MKKFHSLSAILGWLAFVGIATADVRLSGMFSDSMVLQRDAKLPVWGWAEPGEQITVAIDDQKFTATADKATQEDIVAHLFRRGVVVQRTIQHARGSGWC